MSEHILYKYNFEYVPSDKTLHCDLHVSFMTYNKQASKVL